MASLRMELRVRLGLNPNLDVDEAALRRGVRIMDGNAAYVSNTVLIAVLR